MTYNIFIGYDDRDHEAYLVAKHSLQKHATVPIKIHKLHHKTLRSQGLYTRGATIEGSTGQYVDSVDGRPFSTQFTFTRFLIAELWRNLQASNEWSSPMVLFVDNDFCFVEDIGIMFKNIQDQRNAGGGKAPVYCVKHNYHIKESSLKLDGVVQVNYSMKLWASMMVLDMQHKDNLKLTPDLVNTTGGRDLMNFCWVSDVNTIGSIDERWNYIPNHSEDNTDFISAIHFTEGGPYHNNHRDTCGYADVWFQYYEEYVKQQLNKGIKGLEEMIDG